MLGKFAFVDVGQRFPPTVKELHGGVAITDLRHRNQRTALLVHCHPGLGIGDIQVGIGPIDRSGLVMAQRVPLHAILEVQLLLACHQQAAVQVNIGIADVLVGDGRRL
ncbi:hypothetical protein D3C86_1990800 [compost metagenome]